MSSPEQTSPHEVAGRPAGPQGTQLFSVDELRRYAREAAPAVVGPASAQSPVLEGISGGAKGLRFTLRAGRQAIGRSAANDIIIDDPSVSASHAWIIAQRRQYVIMNTLSTNGTFVNGKRIHETILKHNDHVRFGQAEFVFLTREPGAARSRRPQWILAGTILLIVLVATAWWLI